MLPPVKKKIPYFRVISFEKLVQLIIAYYWIASIILLRKLKMFVPKRLWYARINLSKK